LQNIVKALNRAGFSQRDFRTAEPKQPEPSPSLTLTGETLPLNLNPPAPDNTQLNTTDDDGNSIDPSKINVGAITHTENPDSSDDTLLNDPLLDDLKAQAEQANRDYEAEAVKDPDPIPEELERHMNRQKMQERWQEQASKLQLPQFFIRVSTGGFFGEDEALQLFERRGLLKEFRLSQQETAINFEAVDEQIYFVDLKNVGKDDNPDYQATYLKIDPHKRAALYEMILKNPIASQKRDLSGLLAKGIGNLYPITEPEINNYIRRIVDDFTQAQIVDALEHDAAYMRKIREKVDELSDRHIEKVFYRELDLDRIFLQPSYTPPNSITPKQNAPHIPKSLYQHEESMGSFEQNMINKIANLDNVVWWHKNPSRKGFCINGSRNHYPDFIIQMESGKVIVLEAKGDDRDNSDSAAKLKLGKAWEKGAGREFRYMMVFNNNAIEGADNLTDALGKLEHL